MIFAGNKIILATKHKKEKVIKPIFENNLGCKVIVPTDFDTDEFGTFTGEIERLLPPAEMVIKKAQSAMDKYHVDYAIASEGSFGPHPLIPFSPLNHELLAFVDRKTGLNITVVENTTDTNYGFYEVSKEEPIDAYLEQLKFPSHGIIVRALFPEKVVAKGVHSFEELTKSITLAFNISPEGIRLESDMRAMHNPTRMRVIEKLSFNLVERIKSLCPRCQVYGFGKLVQKGNLPCEYCDMPTQLYNHFNKCCIQCDYFVIQSRTDGLTKAPQTYCQLCNP